MTGTMTRTVYSALLAIAMLPLAPRAGPFVSRAAVGICFFTIRWS